jgi:hypothetical protein
LEINKWTLGSVLILEHSGLRDRFITLLASGLVVGIIVLLTLKEEVKKVHDILICFSGWLEISELLPIRYAYIDYYIKRLVRGGIEYCGTLLQMFPDKSYEKFMGSVLFECYILVLLFFKEKQELIKVRCSSFTCEFKQGVQWS